ncbi:phage tail protein [Enterococcus avium]|uniref:phage tail protein n=1 Tax=Enterococcus avium TaxID=33945 RepID=UPI001D089329|nr:phage tail protein [Enterococcus avium]MCB6528781.1 phage tail protein [Enterococcus avium]MCG4866573.1 phage tail protein [Enterococcus avium]MCQ4674628.1 phage tail protein [Enterococcus avium]
MLMAMNLSREYTAILENAYDVGYENIENEIGSIEFSMPLYDTKNAMIQALQYVELTDNEDEYIGLYRIMPSTIQKDKSNYTIKYTAMHVLGTLLDSVLFGYHELVNRTTTDVINYILGKQKTKHWVLKKCEFTRYFSYAWENENGLADALFSIPAAFDEDYIWQWNTQVYPFELSLVKPPTEPICRIQEGYNMEGFEIETDPNNLVNRVYPLGAGEGINQLNIKSVNGGKEYVEDTDSIKKYGLIEYVWVDQRFTIAQALKDNALNMLKKWSIPKVSWKVKASDLIKLTDSPLDIDKLRQGTVVMINTNEYGSFNLRIKKESKSDVFGAPQELELELGNLKDDINTTMSDLGRKQQINETYSQGATNILNYSYQDNCEAAYPAEIEFYLDDDVFHVNTVELTFKTKRYRGYTKAVKGGGAKTITSEAGGKSTQTSSAGGGSVRSTSAGGSSVRSTTSGGGSYQGGSTQGGGGTSQSSAAGGDHNHTVMRYLGDVGKDETVGTARMYQPLGSNFRVILKSASMPGDIVTAGSSGNHSHTVNIPNHSHGFNINIPAHTHNVSIPSHTHSVNIPNHTHTVQIPSHKHNVVLPEHTHPLEWGIFQASGSASSVDIIVDGTTLPKHETNQDRLNIVNYLKKTSSGKIQRGNHTIKIKPNKLARIEAQVTCRVFIQSQLGGQF